MKVRVLPPQLDSVKDSFDTLVIHCAAGVSRSGAVGLFACQYLGLDNSHFKTLVMPNLRVLEMLTLVSWINGNYIKEWENITLTNKDTKIIF